MLRTNLQTRCTVSLTVTCCLTDSHGALESALIQTYSPHILPDHIKNFTAIVQGQFHKVILAITAFLVLRSMAPTIGPRTDRPHTSLLVPFLRFIRHERHENSILRSETTLDRTKVEIAIGFVV